MLQLEDDKIHSERVWAPPAWCRPWSSFPKSSAPHPGSACCACISFRIRTEACDKMAQVNFFGRSRNCFHLNVRWKSVDPTPTSKNSQYSISNLSDLSFSFSKVFFIFIAYRLHTWLRASNSKISSPSFQVLPPYFLNSMARKHWWEQISCFGFWANWCENYDCLSVLQSFHATKKKLVKFRN